MIILSERKKKLEEFQDILKYKFNNIQLLNTSLTHSSYVNESKTKDIVSNERLEFLGDAIIDLVVSEYLYNKFTELPEGELTKRRASVVCESSLAFAARKIKIGEYLLLGKGEEATGGRHRESILADAFEALTGAIYMDSHYETAKEFLLSNFEEEVIYALSKGTLFKDYKTELQELFQKKNRSRIDYIVEKEDGPDHKKKFYINVVAGNKVIGKGIGRNKKEAEQNAAKQALMKLGEKFE